MAMLTRRRPLPKQLTPLEQTALQDLVQALTHALGRGEMSVNLGDRAPKPEGLSAEGWPSTHRQALLQLLRMCAIALCARDRLRFFF